MRDPISGMIDIGEIRLRIFQHLTIGLIKDGGKCWPFLVALLIARFINGNYFNNTFFHPETDVADLKKLL